MNIIKKKINPKIEISVVIATFNRAQNLKKTVESILNQSDPVFEILVIDDGSTDSTKEVVSKFGNKVRYIYTKHCGRPSIPRNIGIKASKGNYIAFCDDDDLWIENKLEKQLLILKNTNFDMCSTNAYKLENGIKIDTKLMPDFNKYPEELTYDFLIEKNIVCTSSVLLKKSILKFQFSSKKYSEDYGQWLSILNDGKKIRFLNEPLLYYRIDGNNKQSKKKKTKIKNINLSRYKRV